MFQSIKRCLEKDLLNTISRTNHKGKVGVQHKMFNIESIVQLRFR